LSGLPARPLSEVKQTFGGTIQLNFFYVGLRAVASDPPSVTAPFPPIADVCPSVAVVSRESNFPVG